MPAYGAEWRTDSLFCLVFVLIGLTFSAREVEGKYLFRRRDHNSNQSSSNEAAPEIECRVFKETILHSNQFGSWDEENFACYPIVNGIESDQDYKISLPTTIKDAYRKDIEAGDFFITFRNAKLEGDEVIGDPNDYLIEAHNSTHTSKNRFLQQVGTRSILVLRVSVRDSEPAFTGGQFHDRIFGYDSLSVQSQYSKCSAGKLNFEPARIGNGILEVRLPDRVIKDFSSPTALSNAAQLAAAELLNLSGDQHISSLADHVMICLPPGIEDDKWVAAAAMNHWRSVYNNRFCGIISVTMHELGHNLGLNHANENGDYLDYTSYMSAGHYEEGYPRKCFNGQNHHHLGKRYILCSPV